MENLTNAKEIRDTAEAKMIAASMDEYFSSESHFVHELESAFYAVCRKSGYEKAREIARELADRPW